MKQLKTILVMLVALTFVSTMAVAWYGGIEGDDYDETVDCGWADTPPTLDGDIDVGEYANATVVDMFYYPEPPHRNDTVYLYFMNDADYLYVAVDLLPDNTSDSGDYIYISIDEDDDGDYEALATQWEGWYVVEVEEEGLLLRAEASGLIAVPYSNEPFDFGAGFEKTPNDEDVNHRVWEIAIPIDNMDGGATDVELGDTIGFMATGYGTLSPAWEYPINITDDDYEDATNWTQLTLAEAPPTAPAVTGWTQSDYAMMFFFIGFFVFLILTVFYKDILQEWIQDQKMNYVYGAMGFGLLMFALGFLEYYYGILSYVGLG